ncbi:helix-turn-helix domain-containing protein [Metamycoplasma hominis]|uniref:helix-turn-helix domain-containing protein n=1 Tax=Metamycoplasma hominis TaxID=2098 RepID=UPI001E479EF4|nr:helix-turn-helix transcriptional regulator [Metamycoplasma hominis]
MALSYNKLWKLLIDKNINKTNLRNMTGISQSTMAKLNKGENVNTEVLERICIALDCQISEIVEVVNKECEKKNNE